MEQAHTKSVEEVSAYFGVVEETGLNEEQIRKSREKYGPNGKLSAIFVPTFIDNFTDFMSKFKTHVMALVSTIFLTVPHQSEYFLYIFRE